MKTVLTRLKTNFFVGILETSCHWHTHIGIRITIIIIVMTIRITRGYHRIPKIIIIIRRWRRRRTPDAQAIVVTVFMACGTSVFLAVEAFKNSGGIFMPLLMLR
jgi:hypothetical protein